MAYPAATEQDIDFYRDHGYIVVTDAIDPVDMEDLITKCDQIIEKKETLAFDWAWEKGKSKDEREFKILQSSPTRFWPELMDAKFRLWAIEYASALIGEPLEFWYDQFLAKPPQKGVPTLWHQDEGYWGRNINDTGITCWMPFHDVDEKNGCMHFIDGGHKDGVLEDKQPDNVQSDLLFCEPDESRAVACPISKGSVTFHHSKTPHMTTANHTDQWRRILTQHLKVVGTEGEGDHYPWKIYVNQFTGDRIKPPSRSTRSDLAGIDAGIDAGQEAIASAISAVNALAGRFDEGAAAAIELLVNAVPGRVVVTGLGKSGLVGAKLAATLSSTGTPSFYIHAADVLHGDSGAVHDGDVVVAISNSGETAEVCAFVELLKKRDVKIIALTGCSGVSTLCAMADVVIDVGVDRECDPYDLVPSASTVATAVMGDALAIAAMVARGFGPTDFREHHPGGALGRRLGADS